MMGDSMLTKCACGGPSSLVWFFLKSHMGCRGPHLMKGNAPNFPECKDRGQDCTCFRSAHVSYMWLGKKYHSSWSLDKKTTINYYNSSSDFLGVLEKTSPRAGRKPMRPMSSHCAGRFRGPYTSRVSTLSAAATGISMACKPVG